MRRKLLSLVLLCCAHGAAAVDVNQATEAQLDSIKGIGPALSGKILRARDQAPFKDWRDLMQRVKGVRSSSATQFSAAGLTVNGASFPDATQPPAGRASDVATAVSR